MSTKTTGDRGEETASNYLQAKGYVILTRNYFTRFGELDIVARAGEWVVFVEVKARKNNGFAEAAASVTPAKRTRIRKAAALWLAHQNCEDPARFDVIEVYSDGQLNHIEHAFM